jgi:hypothetical protein
MINFENNPLIEKTLNSFRYYRFLNYWKVKKFIAKQLLNSGTSIGANSFEAQKSLQ